MPIKQRYRPTLYITRGLPGSGKTTLAEEMVRNSNGALRRVNRDDTRRMMYCGVPWSKERESITVAVRDNIINTLLQLNVDVICDDTNLAEYHVELLHGLAYNNDALFQIINLLDVPLDLCIKRDKERGAAGGREVGETVIRSMHAQYCSSSTQQ